MPIPVKRCEPWAAGRPLTYVFLLGFLSLGPVEDADDLTYKGTQALSGLTRVQGALTVSSPGKTHHPVSLSVFPTLGDQFRAGLAPNRFSNSAKEGL